MSTSPGFAAPTSLDSPVSTSPGFTAPTSLDSPVSTVGVNAATPADLQVVAAQLGRVPRGVVAIGARCVCGRPTVVATAPRLEDGTPFPTLFYLTHPAAAAALSRIEASGGMRSMARLLESPEISAAYGCAHQDYLRRRQELQSRLGVEVPEIAGISAGGMPDRVKCLHALAAHSLAAGPGVNPLGDVALELIKDQWRPTRCDCLPSQ